MVILGAGGQLGYAFSKAYPNAHCFSHGDVDITDSLQVEAMCIKYGPSVIINTAAYPSAEKAEFDNTLEAYRVNVLGALNLARSAKAHNAILVHFSTDYVFDGNSEEGFTEVDIPKPLNVHGLSKLASEQVVAAYHQKHYIFRTSALFGPRSSGFGSNFVTKRIAQAKTDGCLQVVDDQWTVPTYTEDVAQGVKTILEKKLEFGVYHLVNSGSAVSWFEFAKTICRIAGIETPVHPITTEASNSLLNRGRYSVLRDTKLASAGVTLPVWEDALERYIERYQ